MQPSRSIVVLAVTEVGQLRSEQRFSMNLTVSPSSSCLTVLRFLFLSPLSSSLCVESFQDRVCFCGLEIIESGQPTLLVDGIVILSCVVRIPSIVLLWTGWMYNKIFGYM